MLVTGAAGYLGRRVVTRLVKEGVPVQGLVRSPDSLPPNGNEQAVVDLTDLDALGRTLSRFKPGTIVHCAAYIPRAGDEVPDMLSQRNNVEATRNLLQAAARSGARRIVFASSISVYSGQPVALDAAYDESQTPVPEGAYGRDKLSCEDACAAWAGQTGGSSVSLRLAGLHGGNRKSGVVFNFLRSALDGDALTVAAPDSVVQPLFIEDAVQALVSACGVQARSRSAVYNVAGKERVSLLELAKRTLALCNSASGLTIGAKPGRSMAMNIDRATEALGFVPTPLAEWMRRELTLLQENTR